MNEKCTLKASALLALILSLLLLCACTPQAPEKVSPDVMHLSAVLEKAGYATQYYEEGNATLSALAEGKPVLLYTPGLPEVPKNRALAASLAASQRELKNWGVIFTDGGRKRLVTAEEARDLRRRGLRPGPGAVLTPLAKEILEGSD